MNLVLGRSLLETKKDILVEWNRKIFAHAPGLEETWEAYSLKMSDSVYDSTVQQGFAPPSSLRITW